MMSTWTLSKALRPKRLLDSSSDKAINVDSLPKDFTSLSLKHMHEILNAQLLPSRSA